MFWLPALHAMMAAACLDNSNVLKEGTVHKYENSKFRLGVSERDMICDPDTIDIRNNAIRCVYDAKRYDTRYDTQCDASRYEALRYEIKNTSRCDLVRCDMVRCDMVQCDSMRYETIRMYNTKPWCDLGMRLVSGIMQFDTMRSADTKTQIPHSNTQKPIRCDALRFDHYDIILIDWKIETHSPFIKSSFINNVH